MDRLFYAIFSIFLYLWTTRGMTYGTSVPKITYLMGVLILYGFVTSVIFFEENRQVRKGALIAAVLMNVGLSIAYRVSNPEYENSLEMNFSESYVNDLLPMFGIFVAVVLVVRYTKLYRIRLINILLAAALPVAVFGARLTGKCIHGAYLYFAGMMIFGLVLMGFPFVAAFFLSEKEERYLGGNVEHLSLNLLGLLLYTFLLFIGCAACNEFGLLLILGLTTSVLFFIRCRNWATKLFYTLACGAGFLAAGRKVSHVADRIQIWLNPKATFGDIQLAAKAESVLYVFRNVYRMGWWGNGIGDLSSRIYTTLDTDHALVTLMNDYSIFFMLLVLIAGIMCVRWMLIPPPGLGTYDRYLNLTCGLIMGFMILIDAASNLGSFITAGIGFPWVSNGSSVNMMLMALLAVHTGLMGRRKQSC